MFVVHGMVMLEVVPIMHLTQQYVSQSRLSTVYSLSILTSTTQFEMSCSSATMTLYISTNYVESANTRQRSDFQLRRNRLILCLPPC